MTKVLLSVHVLAAILVVGPITVAASLFPRYARRPAPGAGDGAGAGAGAPEGAGAPDGRGPATAALLHRICRGYAVAGIAVPVFGLATGAQLGVLTDAWLITSIVLTAVAAAVLVLAVIPGQRRMLALGAGGDATVDPAGDGTAKAPAGDGGQRRAAARLAAVTGVFNILWAVVVVLMIVRPGSTTGA
ncbi:hypothetical protein IHE55_07130 [Streptomyces pactum]|uniref:Protease n=1 Tax=Streptomyces pactum TaxID=68249 RepID=A0ABS0NHB2_9ACTN|nr:hypothetical protein [Streptomyces pactum]MBH5334586.1 hypothetical protein [Streptomyces pactum]